ncbi:hypothetical protein LAZ67_1000453 [Cordylochernes scorpioides]|uniref:Transposase n=1 Tax=Cordylochernes scorpioides TaxID=51811 RepID=A0ABY6JW62_9ARAC|nr:hypothetical protein LAZ67_1000453 [Cordylochernes scorpioides]
MEAPLKDCTTLEQRAVIRFLNAEGIQTSQICQRMKNIYGESCLSQKNIYKQVNKFKNGRITYTNIERPGRPSVTATPSTINAKNIHFYHRQRMNSDLHCDILVNKLKPGIRSKRRGKLSKGVLFLRDNARPHTSCKTVSTIIKLEHPAYSPDLAPSDYFLFGLLKKELKGKRFDSDEDVQKVVQDFFTRFLRVPIKRVFTSCQNDGDDCISTYLEAEKKAVELAARALMAELWARAWKRGWQEWGSQTRRVPLRQPLNSRPAGRYLDVGEGRNSPFLNAGVPGAREEQVLCCSQGRHSVIVGWVQGGPRTSSTLLGLLMLGAEHLPHIIGLKSRVAGWRLWHRSHQTDTDIEWDLTYFLRSHIRTAVPAASHS